MKMPALFYGMLLWAIIGFAGPSFAQGGKTVSWKTISHELYSITIPDDWTGFPPERSRDTRPSERDGGPYHLYCMCWTAPGKGMGSRSAPFLYVESCYRLDGTPLSTEVIEGEKMRGSPLSRNVVRMKAKPGQKRYMVLKEDTMMGVGGSSWYKQRSFCLIQQEGKLVHYLEFMVGEDYWQLHPELRHVAERVLDSFQVKPFTPE